MIARTPCANFKRQQRARRQVAIACANAAAEIQFGYRQPDVFAQIGRGRSEIARQLQPRVTPLPDDRRIRIGIGRFQRQVLAIEIHWATAFRSAIVASTRISACAAAIRNSSG